MRISDWSSDVCSSDLISSEFGGVLIFEGKATSVAGKDSRINGNATLHLGGAIYMPNQDMEMTGNASPSTQCLLLIANTIGISGNPIIPNSCPPGRSEEHTSELQSLMRI